MRFDAPRGTADHLPDREPVREAIVDAAKRTASRYAYRRILTPTFEDTNLFARTSGEGSDVVKKEMYSFEDQSGRPLTLRPEGTASVARAYVQHGLNHEPQPVKLYYVSPMFRYSRSQRGRYREFWQIGLEAIGSEDPALEAELIAAFRAITREVRTLPLRLEVNSIGDSECRPAYIEKLRKYLARYTRHLDSDSRARLEVSPLRVFDTKDTRTQEILRAAPKITENLCDPCNNHFRAFRRYLRALRVRHVVVPTLVRGLDYYTRTVWEFHNSRLGAQSSVCAGGRYDDLIAEIGGRPTPGVGWAAGIERIALSIPTTRMPTGWRLDVLLVAGDDNEKAMMLALMEQLRGAFICDMTFGRRQAKRRFAEMGRRNPRLIVVAESGIFSLREEGQADRRFRSVERLHTEITRRLS